MIQTVTGFVIGWTNTGRFPYAYATLACGHAAKTVLKPHRGACGTCGVEIDLPANGAAQCCGRSMFYIRFSPNPHNEADRVTCVGDVVECEICDAEAKQLEWLRNVDLSELSHARFRHGSYFLYRRDPSSPSGVFMMGSVRRQPQRRQPRR